MDHYLPENQAIIISGADDGYFNLLSDLVQSIRAQPEGRSAVIGILDFGLTDTQIEWLLSKSAKVVRPGWDLSFPGMEHAPDSAKGKIAKAFLPGHFPGYGVYVWLDADTWLQEWEPVRLLLEGARRDGMAGVPECDRSYPLLTAGLRARFYRGIPFLHSRVRALRSVLQRKLARFYSPAIGQRHAMAPLVNGGAFAIAAEAPHWQAWVECYRAARIRDYRDLSDQAPLNYAIHSRNLPCHFLPAWCNWMCNLAIPMLDESTGLLVEASLPHHPIGLVHMAGETRNRTYDLASTSGGLVRTSLRRRDITKLAVGVRAAGLSV